MNPGGSPVRIVADDHDDQLVEALRRHEDSAAERLVIAYQGRAYRLAIGITANAEDAEEVVQDAFWSAIRKIDTFRGQSKFGSWLYRIVANRACNKLRARRGKRLEITLDDVLPIFDEDGQYVEPVTDWSARVDDPCTRAEVRLAVTSAFEELPSHYRAALVLRDIEGLSAAEVAHVLCISLANARSRIHRARLFIRKRLSGSLSVGRFHGALLQPA